MSKFVLKTTTDGIRHLYLDDPDKDGFEKLSQSEKAKLFNLDRCAVLYENRGGVKQLFGIIDNKVFHIEIPFDARIDFIGSVYLFEKNGEWNTIKFSSDKWREQALGHKEYMYMSSQYIIKYNHACWVYFLKKCGSGVMLSHVVNDRVVVLGTYRSVSQDHDKLIAERDDKYYDIYKPCSVTPIKGSKNEFFDTKNGLYIWNSSKEAWMFLSGYESIGKNAVYRTSVWTSFDGLSGERIELYRICDGELYLVLEGKKWSEALKPLGLQIDDMVYLVDAQTGCIDFENPAKYEVSDSIG